MRVRNWVLTSFRNDPPEFSDKYMRYMCYQREKCPKSGKLHWQGYVELKEGLELSAVKIILEDPKVHLEPRKGTQQQAIDYCMKKESAVADSFEQIGIKKKQGSRSDLDSIWEAVESGATKLELLSEFRGNAFRHLGMIDRAQKAVHGFDDMDNYIIRYRRNLADLLSIAEKCHELQHTEVAGNTKQPLKFEKKLSTPVIWSDAESDVCE